MVGATAVNDEFEVGFDQTFESHWYRAEQAGRVVMVVFALAAALGFLGRGPFSHAETQSAGAVAVDYEPITRHGTTTTVTVHVKQPRQSSRPIELRVNQQIIEPTGFQRSILLANSSSVSNDGMRLTFNEAADLSFNRRRMSRLRLTEQDIMAVARQHGLMRLQHVRYAVAEHDGKISFVQEAAA